MKIMLRVKNEISEEHSDLEYTMESFEDILKNDSESLLEIIKIMENSFLIKNNQLLV